MLLNVNRQASILGSLSATATNTPTTATGWQVALSQTFASLAGTVADGLRFWSIRVNNLSGVGIRVVFDSSTATTAPFTTTPATRGIVVLPGETQEFDVSTLGGDTGVLRLLYIADATGTGAEFTNIACKVDFEATFYSAEQSA